MLQEEETREFSNKISLYVYNAGRAKKKGLSQWDNVFLYLDLALH